MAIERITQDQVIAAFRAARVAGTNAGNARIQELAKQPVPNGKMLEACGGSALYLDVDGRTMLGKILAEIGEQEFSVRSFHGGGFSAHIRYDLKLIPPVNGQEFSINYDADKAAAEVLEEKLKVSVYARQHID